MTINVPGPPNLLSTIDAGSEVELNPEQIRFAKYEITLQLDKAKIWSIHKPDLPPTSENDRKGRLTHLAEKVYFQRPGVGLSPLLPLLFGDSENPSGKNHLNHGIDEYQKDLIGQVTAGKPLPLNETLRRFLGRGSGLTPTGDDLILGLTLALNRWNSLLLDTKDPFLINRTIMAAAYGSTTTLSANLIECATLGLADERLITSLDWIMTGAGRINEVTKGILGWGSDSGIAALVGMGIAMIAQIK